MLRGEAGATQGDAGALGTPASKALCWGVSALGPSTSSLEVRRLILGLLRTEPFTAGLLRTVMRVARAGLCTVPLTAFINAEVRAKFLRLDESSWVGGVPLRDTCELSKSWDFGGIGL